MKVTLIVPVLYEEGQLSSTLERLATLRDRLDLEILLVVDVPDPSRLEASRGTNDPIAERVGARSVYRPGRRGFGSALRDGFARSTGDVVIPFMGDECDDARDVPRLVDAIVDGWDVVAGSRYMPGGRIVGNTMKQRLSRLYGFLVRAVGGPKIHDVSNAFKAYRRTVIESIATVAESFDISVELTVKAHRAGFSVAEIPTRWTNRQLGTSSWRFASELRRYLRWLVLAARPISRQRAAAVAPGDRP
ncbi:MAG TPA: glycosyltransferase [Actinomycetota bacterium]|nr:glycosyltransferase [Actinomycetota bacterium]